MTESGAIIGLAPWFRTPLGSYLLDWEQRHLDAVVADLFGFHALQVGLPELHALAANRMPHRWLATAGLPVAAGDVPSEGTPLPEPPSLCCDYDALPFDSRSLDLVVMPHALELARDAHLALGEVERVLRPEGRVVIVGFNSASLWGAGQAIARLARRFGATTPRVASLPAAGDYIGYRRLRDWLRLLSFEVEVGRFGCYRPPLANRKWLARMAWMDRAGERWWPVLGAVYLIVAVKRVRGMRLVGLAREQRLQGAAAPAIVARHHRAPLAISLDDPPTR